MIDELFEYGVYLALLVALAIPLSAYLNKVMAGQKTVLSRVLVPVENAVYRCIRVDKSEDMGWKRYLVSAFAFSAICLVGLFAILMLQGLLPFNPEAPAVLGSRVQHRRQLRHEHELAGVQRRERAQLLLPGDRPDGAELRHARRGLGRLFALFRGIVSEGIRASETSGSM